MTKDEIKDVLRSHSDGHKYFDIDKIASTLHNRFEEERAKLNNYINELVNDIIEIGEIHIQQLTKARIEENQFYTDCPSTKIMNKAARFRMSELEVQLKKENKND